nr:MAG TPA: hypothetical protein [Caudoviricetes sp.]
MSNELILTNKVDLCYNNYGTVSKAERTWSYGEI